MSFTANSYAIRGQFDRTASIQDSQNDIIDVIIRLDEKNDIIWLDDDILLFIWFYHLVDHNIDISSGWIVTCSFLFELSSGMITLGVFFFGRMIP